MFRSPERWRGWLLIPGAQTVGRRAGEGDVLSICVLAKSWPTETPRRTACSRCRDWGATLPCWGDRRRSRNSGCRRRAPARPVCVRADGSGSRFRRGGALNPGAQGQGQLRLDGAKMFICNAGATHYTVFARTPKVPKASARSWPTRRARVIRQMSASADGRTPDWWIAISELRGAGVARLGELVGACGWRCGRSTCSGRRWARRRWAWPGGR